MMVVEGLPLVRITRLEACPRCQVVIVQSADLQTLERDTEDEDDQTPESICRWVFGPGTETPWPGGDYYRGSHYVEPAFQTYPEFVRGPYNEDHYLIDPDYQMDFGL